MGCGEVTRFVVAEEIFVTTAVLGKVVVDCVGIGVGCRVVCIVELTKFINFVEDVLVVAIVVDVLVVDDVVPITTFGISKQYIDNVLLQGNSFLSVHSRLLLPVAPAVPVCESDDVVQSRQRVAVRRPLTEVPVKTDPEAPLSASVLLKSLDKPTVVKILKFCANIVLSTD